VRWELQKGRYAFVVEENGGTFGDEIHLLKFLTVGNNHFAGLENSAIHIHNQLVCESDFCVYEKATKLTFECFKK
jgi:hypothetical protein